MSLDAVIQRPDKAPLGSVAAIQAALKRIFPGTEFVIQREPAVPPDLVALQAAAEKMLHGGGDVEIVIKESRYPYHSGSYSSPTGFAIEFTIEPDDPIRRVEATLYGNASNAIDYFDRLFELTGWRIEYS